MNLLTGATLTLVGVNGSAIILQFLALAGRWALLAQAQTGGFAARAALAEAAQGSDALVAGAVGLSLLTLAPAYVVSSFWIYNAACNIRALGARGMQISPGWAVGWFAVPIASLMMPFQGMEEIYLASGSPISWKKLKTPLLLRIWWGAWLMAGLGGYIIGIFSRMLGTALPDIVFATQLAMADLALSITCCVMFLTIVWRVHRAQSHSHATLGSVAEVFA
jgi:hypothetical protein